MKPFVREEEPPPETAPSPARMSDSVARATTAADTPPTTDPPDSGDVVLRGIAAAPATAPPAQVATLLLVKTDAGTGDERKLIQSAIEKESGFVTTLDGGFTAGVFSSDGDASLQATRAAAATFALRKELPHARIALTTGRFNGGALSDRATALLSSRTTPGTSLDEATAGLLESQLEIGREGASIVLVGQREFGSNARPAATEAATVTPESLQFTKWGLRFADPANEAAYLKSSSAPGNRSVQYGPLIGSLFTVIGLVGIWITAHQHFWTILALVAVSLAPCYLTRFIVQIRPRLSRWRRPVGIVTDGVNGFFLVVVFYGILRMPDTALIWMIVFGILVFSIGDENELESIAVLFPVFALQQWYVLEAFGSSKSAPGSLVWYTAIPWSVFVAGVIVCVYRHREARIRWRQDRVIELQRVELDRLLIEARAREVKMLNEEVRRQVAERARDLAESLLQIRETPEKRGLVPGDVVEDRYRVIRVLGSGGMGEVHEVERLADHRRLALKMMTNIANRKALVRFAREAQIAAQLDHPNVVSVIDVGGTRSGALFLVMQLISGTTLAAQSTHFGDSNWAIPILLQIARALAAMHAQGIIHRDLKPQNIMLDGGQVKVGDFGISSLVEKDEAGVDRSRLTRTGALVGTPFYMAPELAAGTREATSAADIFSLGVVAFEMLANGAPYSLPPVLELLAGREPPVPPPLGQAAPSVNAALGGLIDRCLSHAPQKRPTALDVVHMLAGLEPFAARDRV